MIACKRVKGATNKGIVGVILSTVWNGFEEDNDSMISNLVNGKKNPSDEIRKQAEVMNETAYNDLIESFAYVLTEYIDPNKIEKLYRLICYIIFEDTSINDDTVVDLVGMTTKEDIGNSDPKLEKFLAGVLIYTLRYTDNIGANEYVKEVIEKSKGDCVSYINPKINSSEINNTFEDEEILSDARRFCLIHEDEIRLLPLCQMAFNVDPTHKNVRPMYTEYILLPQKVKSKVLEIKGLPTFEFTKDWIDEAISKYDQQILDMGLATRSFLYEGAKYFHRAYERYSSMHIVEYNPRLFEPLFTEGFTAGYIKKNKSTLGSYIGDFLWYKVNKPEKKVMNPMDYLWKDRELGSCPEPEITYWVCLFIILSCYSIMDDSILVDDRWQNVSIDDDLIETQEDMYYYALLQLYMTYELKNHRNDNF